MREFLVVALVVACPLMMFWMMRSGQGHGHSDDGHDHARQAEPHPASTRELHRQRDELDREIKREQFEGEGPYERNTKVTRPG